MARFAARLREAREAAGMTQGALADACGVTLNTVSNWEQGEKPPRDPFAIARAAQALRVPVGYLLGEDADATDAHVRLQMYEAGRREMGEWIGQMIQAAIEGPQVVTQRIAEPASETFQTATRDNLSAVERAARTGPKRRKTGGK